MTQRFTFKKAERLSGKKLIDELFTKGSSFSFYPFRVFTLEKKTEESTPAQILISVSAKNFKRAVDRNKIKRLIRETFRLNKQSLYDSLEKSNRQILIGVLYTSKSIEPFAVVNEKLIAVLNRLATDYGKIEKNNP